MGETMGETMGEMWGELTGVSLRITFSQGGVEAPDMVSNWCLGDSIAAVSECQHVLVC